MRLPKIILTGDARLAAFPDPRDLHEGTWAVVGWKEWAGLPGLGIARLRAKIDTGARTSALHARQLKVFQQGGEDWISFRVIGGGEGRNPPRHQAPISDKRMIRSSNGQVEERYVITTLLELAGRSWQVDVTLTDRQKMELPMLIGREALEHRLLVDVAKAYVWGRPGLRGKKRKIAGAT